MGKALCDSGVGAEGACGLSLRRVTRIFITHLHGDHVFGLPGLLLTLAAQRGRAEDGEGGGEDEAGAPDAAAAAAAAAPVFQPFSEDSEFLEVVGPRGLGALLRTCLSASDAGAFGFRYRVTELLGEGDNDDAPPLLHVSEAPPRLLRPDDDGAFTVAPGVAAARIDHRVVCYGYSVSEAPRSPALDAAKARGLGATGKELGRLKIGEDVALADGRVVRAAEVLAPAAPPRCVVHLGDCLDNSAAARAARGAAGPCPLLARARAAGHVVAAVVHEATFCDAQEAHAVPKGHSTARHAAAYAAEAGAAQLILTHLSQRYLPRSSGAGAAAVIDALEEEARAELRARGAGAWVRCVEDFEAVNAAVGAGAGT